MPGLSGLDPETLFGAVGHYEKLGLAVSGGPDSLALLLLAARWAKGRDTRLFVYTVDHGLRPEAAIEAEMVVREAGRLGLAARALRWDGPHPEAGIMAAAREARYRLMADAMAADGVPLLLTAHHRSDQAETVLMRLAHGSGIGGLRGMDALSFVAGCEIYRPLLGVDPALLRQVVEEAGLVPADDPSNRDGDYERVRWREMLPALAALGLDAARLATFARRMDEAGSMIAEATAVAHGELVERPATGRAELSQGKFGVLPVPVGVMLLGQVLETISGNRKAPPLAALEALRERLSLPQPAKPATLHGCVISSNGESIVITPERPRKSPPAKPSRETGH